MAKYNARMLDADTGGEGSYDFDGVDNLMDQSPVTVVRTFMEHVDRKILPREHIDYELNAAFKNKDRRVVTALGSLILPHDGPLPFLLMISPAST